MISTPPQAHTTTPPPLQIGERAPYFSLPATDGKLYSMADFSQAKLLVVLFTCNHCPFAQACEGRVLALVEQFAPQGVAFVGICSNDEESFPEDSFERMKERSAALGFPFPYLQDREQKAAKAYSARCTPEVFVFDETRALRYHGGIDDSHRDESAVTRPFLKTAIEELLSGAEVTSPDMPSIGCVIKWRL